MCKKSKVVHTRYPQIFAKDTMINDWKYTLAMQRTLLPWRRAAQKNWLLLGSMDMRMNETVSGTSLAVGYCIPGKHSSNIHENVPSSIDAGISTLAPAAAAGGSTAGGCWIEG